MKRRGWDGLADWFCGMRESPEFDMYRVETPQVEALLAPCHGLRVLDLGCAGGYYARHCRRENAWAVGLDVSMVMLARARRADPAGAGTYVCARAGRMLPFRDSAFDLVVCSTLLRLVRDKEAVYRECRRVLTDEGRLILSDAHPLTHIYARRRMAILSGRLAMDEGGYFSRVSFVLDHEGLRHRIYPCTVSDMVNGLLAAGFSITGVYEPADPEAMDEQEMFASIPRYIVIDARCAGAAPVNAASGVPGSTSTLT